ASPAVASSAAGAIIASTGVEIRFSGEKRAEAREPAPTVPVDAAPAAREEPEPSARAAPEVPSPTPRPTPEELPVEARDPSDTTEESAEGEPAPAPPAPDRSSADAADLPPNFGLLLVESSQNDAIVYIQGREVGPVNQKL